MKRIKLSILNYSTICIYSDNLSVIGEFEKSKLKIMKTLPVTSVMIEDCPETGNNLENAMLIVQGFENAISFHTDKNLAIVTIRSDQIRILDFIYILLEMFVNDLSNKSKYLLHSSALQYDDGKSILLVGSANAGKSTLAYHLITRYNMKLISNDHTLIGQEESLLKTFTGTKPLELRCGVIDRYFPELRPLIQDIKEEEWWDKKTIVDDYMDKTSIASDCPTVVSDIFQIDLCENGSCFLKTRNSIDQRLFLYEQLSKQLKGTYNLITGFNYPMPSIETADKLKELNDQITCYLQNVQVHMGKGTLTELSKQMVKKLEK